MDHTTHPGEWKEIGRRDTSDTITLEASQSEVRQEVRVRVKVIKWAGLHYLTSKPSDAYVEMGI